MKKWLCVLLACSLLLCGCSKDRSAESAETYAETEAEILPEHTEAPGEPAAESFGLAYVEKYGFNPYNCICITNRPVFSLVYESLFVLSNRFEPEPVLCDQFAVSESGKNYVFTLCEGITFSDGDPLTAADVVASLEAARDSDYYGTRFSKVASFSAKDSRTVQIDLYYPYENLPLLLDVPVVKASTVKDSEPVGSGPYAFSRNGSAKTLSRNPNWWQDRSAPVEYDTILLTAAKDPTEIRDSFEFGDTSLVCADLNAPTAVGYRCDYELWDCPTTTMLYIGFNLGAGMFVNREFRSAVTHAIDRKGIITSVYKGFGEPAYLACSPASGLYDAELAENYKYDLSAFQQARNQAGIHPDYVGTLLVCSADPTRVETAHRIAEMLTAAGARVDVTAVDYDTYRYRLNVGQYDLFIGEARLSGNYDLTEFFKKYGSLCIGGIQSAAMEQLCYDALENSGNCYDLQRNVMEHGYICPILFKSYAVMANRGTISNLQPAVDNVFHLPGGRTLADASTTYEALTNPGSGEETEEQTP